jgi:hypothetical protein
MQRKEMQGLQIVRKGKHVIRSAISILLLERAEDIHFFVNNFILDECTKLNQRIREGGALSVGCVR